MNSKLFETPILVYSSHCKYSTALIKTFIEKYPSVFDNIVRMNIDVQKDTKTRPDLYYIIQDNLGNNKLEVVPSLITTNGPSGTSILTGDSILFWAEMKNKTNSIKNETPVNNSTTSGPSGFGGGDNFESFIPSMDSASKNSGLIPSPNVVLKRKEEVSEIIKPISSSEIGSKDEVKKRYEDLLASRKQF